MKKAIRYSVRWQNPQTGESMERLFETYGEAERKHSSLCACIPESEPKFSRVLVEAQTGGAA